MLFDNVRTVYENTCVIAVSKYINIIQESLANAKVQ